MRSGTPAIVLACVAAQVDARAFGAERRGHAQESVEKLVDESVDTLVDKIVSKLFARVSARALDARISSSSVSSFHPRSPRPHGGAMTPRNRVPDPPPAIELRNRQTSRGSTKAYATGKVDDEALEGAIEPMKIVIDSGFKGQINCLGGIAARFG